MGAMRKKSELPVNGEILAWARKRQRRSTEETAKSVGVSPDRLEAWEAGEAKPTVSQARRLAEVYRVPFLEFFSSTLPTLPIPVLIPDFRQYRDAEAAEEALEITEVQGWAEEQRLNAIDLFEIIGEQVPKLPPDLKAKIGDKAEDVGASIRKLIGPAPDLQMNLDEKGRRGFPAVLRRHFERVGVLVLKAGALARVRTRGLCIFADPLPIIVFTNESPNAQAFTLAHEFAHVLLQQSAISGPMPIDDGTPESKLERWCNEFAASFLIPKDMLAAVRERPQVPAPNIDDDTLGVLARAFAVSAHAMLIRLVSLGYVDGAFYWGVKREQFLRAEGQFKGGGRPEYYGTRYRSAHGDLYTGLVLEAWGSGRITNHNAAEFMGIKNLAHLSDIRDHFGK